MTTIKKDLRFLFPAMVSRGAANEEILCSSHSWSGSGFRAGLSTMEAFAWVPLAEVPDSTGPPGIFCLGLKMLLNFSDSVELFQCNQQTSTSAFTLIVRWNVSEPGAEIGSGDWGDTFFFRGSLNLFLYSSTMKMYMKCMLCCGFSLVLKCCSLQIKSAIFWVWSSDLKCILEFFKQITFVQHHPDIFHLIISIKGANREYACNIH